MAPKQRDIGWEHGLLLVEVENLWSVIIVGNKSNSGITRLKQHIAHVLGQVKVCLRVSKEVSQIIIRRLSEGSKERAAIKSKK